MLTLTSRHAKISAGFVHSKREAAMKSVIVTNLVLISTFIAAQANADCTDRRLNQTQLSSALSGNTVCGRAISGTDQWQEEHQGNGAGPLWDYKMGDGNTVDPRRLMGSWNITGAGSSAAVSYTYDQFGPATTSGPYSVHTSATGNPPFPQGTVFSFCSGGAEIARAYVVNGTNVGCNNAFP